MRHLGYKACPLRVQALNRPDGASRPRQVQQVPSIQLQGTPVNPQPCRSKSNSPRHLSQTLCACRLLVSSMSAGTIWASTRPLTHNDACHHQVYPTHIPMTLCTPNRLECFHAVTQRTPRLACFHADTLRRPRTGFLCRQGIEKTVDQTTEHCQRPFTFHAGEKAKARDNKVDGFLGRHQQSSKPKSLSRSNPLVAARHDIPKSA